MLENITIRFILRNVPLNQYIPIQQVHNWFTHDKIYCIVIINTQKLKLLNMTRMTKKQLLAPKVPKLTKT